MDYRRIVMGIGILCIGLVLAAGVAACKHKPSTSKNHPASAREPTTKKPRPAGGHTSASKSAHMAASAANPYETLAQLDGRTPVPLLPMMANHQKQEMRQHLVAIQKIVAGISKHDFAAIEQAAKPIESSPKMAKLCHRMGAGAQGFTPRALHFHKTADRIGSAAKQKDMPAVIKALGATLQTCADCHSRFQQHPVSPQIWKKKTGMAPPMGKMP